MLNTISVLLVVAASSVAKINKRWAVSSSMRNKNEEYSDAIRLGFVVSEFNYDITMVMLERAKQHADFLGAKVSAVVMVPGVFDMGLAVKHLLQRMSIDGVVALGAVIEGETEHDDVVIQQAARKIADLAVQFEKPVGLGITGPGMSRLQAEVRIERAKMAVESVVKLHRTLHHASAEE